MSSSRGSPLKCVLAKATLTGRVVHNCCPWEVSRLVSFPHAREAHGGEGAHGSHMTYDKAVDAQSHKILQDRPGTASRVRVALASAALDDPKSVLVKLDGKTGGVHDNQPQPSQSWVRLASALRPRIHLKSRRGSATAPTTMLAMRQNQGLAMTSRWWLL